MGHKYAAFGHLNDLRGHFMEFRRIGHHFVSDVGEFGEVGRDEAFGIDEGAEFIHHRQAIVFKDADLGNASPLKSEARAAGFDINDGKHLFV